MTKNEAAAYAEILFNLTAPHTQQEIADKLGLTQQQVSEIERRALDKLAAKLKEKAIRMGVNITDMW